MAWSPYQRIPREGGLQGISGLSEKDFPTILDLELESRHELDFWFTEETEPAFGTAVAIAICVEGEPTPPSAPHVSKLTHHSVQLSMRT